MLGECKHKFTVIKKDIYPPTATIKVLLEFFISQYYYHIEKRIEIMRL